MTGHGPEAEVAVLVDDPTQDVEGPGWTSAFPNRTGHVTAEAVDLLVDTKLEEAAAKG